MIDENYSPVEVEQEAQAFWDKQQSFKVTEDLSKEKFYCLTMFPYPSGHLHMGHMRVYAIGDVISRYQRMLGKNVLQPMGWDAFGLPAENAAIQKQIPPAKWTYENIDYMRDQLKRLGLAYDWRREIITCKPDYYRWEQWLFVKMVEKGLAYKKNAIVNWDPVDQTVLANEQVVDGRGWRSGALVERREISQWFLKITAYADELLDDLAKLEHWPEQVRIMQQNWIGRSEGVSIKFKVADSDKVLSVYTTRADTLLGATYLAIAPQHPLAKQAAKDNTKLKAFLDQCSHVQVSEEAIATQEKAGVATGFEAYHPITNKKLPIWVANFVLMEYGAGAVMSVPAHDQRDFEFASKYDLPIEPVIETGEKWDYSKAANTDKGRLINSGEFDGLDSDAAINAIAEVLAEKEAGEKQVHYRLRDWGISRQRYWGTPVPIINCPSCGPVPVPEADLPVVLPEDVQFTGSSSPLKDMPEFMQTTCPNCHEAAQRETDTFDTFVESAWYYTRYCSYNQEKAILDDRAKYWTPVDQYVGGIEHAVMHLLYARFIHKILRDLGMLNSDEPFTHLLTQGMVLKDGAKMSKSKGNVVSPETMIQKYGADTVRVFSLFAAPPEQLLEWSDAGVEGAHRFLRRVWLFAQENYGLIRENNKLMNTDLVKAINWEQAPTELLDTRRQVHELLRQARHDYARQQFNTVISACMKQMNLLSKMMQDHNIDKDEQQKLFVANICREGFSIVLRLLAPIAPHITHHLWRELAYGDNILNAKWPKVNPDALKSETVELVVQVNGKLRSKINVPSEADEATITKLATTDEKIIPYLEQKTLAKTIIVPGKLVNLVVK